MKTIKLLLLLIAVLLSVNLFSGERAKRRPLSHYTDPKSPSYVPFPYPKNEEELLEDLRYYVMVIDADTEGVYYSSVDNEPPPGEKELRGIFDPRSPYKIDSIWRVKNRYERLPDKFMWYVIVTEKGGDVVQRISMRESGLFSGCSTIDQKTLEQARGKHLDMMIKYRKKCTRKTVERILFNSPEKNIRGKKIKSIERVAFPSSKFDSLNPIWEMCMNDGTTYYYDQLKDILYGVKYSIPWFKKGENNRREYKLDLAPPPNIILPDTVGDQIIVLREISRNCR